MNSTCANRRELILVSFGTVSHVVVLQMSQILFSKVNNLHTNVWKCIELLYLCDFEANMGWTKQPLVVHRRSSWLLNPLPEACQFTLFYLGNGTFNGVRGRWVVGGRYCHDQELELSPKGNGYLFAIVQEWTELRMYWIWVLKARIFLVVAPELGIFFPARRPYHYFPFGEQWKMCLSCRTWWLYVN